MCEPLLRVENLRTYLHTPRGDAKAVDGINFTVEAGETLAIVGESGCGKSMTALSIMQLLPEPGGIIAGGRILYEGSDLLDLNWTEMRQVRGKEISMIFQEPLTALNGVFTVGTQIVEAMKVHGTAHGEAAGKRAIELLDRVQIRGAASVLKQYPHELSGGMRQRVMIAMALANGPRLLLADEPTTALDVTVQAQILDLLAELQRETGMAELLITHDLGVVARVAHRVAVMYAGQIVEQGKTEEVLKNPRHPYTRGLMASLPSRKRRGEALYTMEGIVPHATNWPGGCRFADRCPQAQPVCKAVAPKEEAPGSDRPVRCHLFDPEVDMSGKERAAV